jgi:hypothetical protein
MAKSVTTTAKNPALHGKANRDRNTRGAGRTSAKTDVFIHEFLRDPIGMKDRIAAIAAKYKKRDGDRLEISTVKSWYSNWKSGTVKEVRRAIATGDWSALKTAYYPAAVDEHQQELLDALEAIAAAKR